MQEWLVHGVLATYACKQIIKYSSTLKFVWNRKLDVSIHS